MSKQTEPFLHACHMATTDSVKQHRLRKLIASLSEKEALEPELISVYLPLGVSVDAVSSILKAEPDAASPKPAQAKDRLHETRRSLIQRLKQQKEIPENGKVIFAGFSFENNQQVFNFEEVVPPEPVPKFLFMIDTHFRLEPLREMLRDQKIVGLLAMDAKDAGFGVFAGGHLELVDSITSGVPGKSGKGGQSQRRYEREREMELENYFHRVAEHAQKAFLVNHRINVLLIGGPGQTKNDFLKGDYLHYELRNAFLDALDTQSAGVAGVKEALNKSVEELENMCSPEEKRTVERLLTELSKQDGLVTYGLNSVLSALAKGAAKVVVATDDTDLVEYTVICKRCGSLKSIISNKKNIQELHEMATTPCVKCGGSDYETTERDIIDVLEDAASKTDATVEVISTESQEKAKLNGLGGVAAFLRFRVS